MNEGVGGDREGYCQLSEVRIGWALMTLSDVVDLKTGPFGSALHKSDYVTGGTPLINPSHIKNNRLDPDPAVSVDDAARLRLKEFRLRSEDVVMGRRGEMGRCAVVPNSADGWICGTGSVIVRPSPAINSAFLQRLLSAPETVNRLIGDSVGSTMVNLNQRVLLGLPVGLPPLDEQQRIADKLDAVLARVDACRDRLARVAPLLKRFRQSVLAAATSGRLTDDWRESRGAAAAIETVLQATCQQRRVITYGVVKLGDETPGGIPCLRTSNVRWLQFQLDGLKHIRPSLSAEYGRTVLLGGEVLVCVRGTLGGVAVATSDMVGWNVSREVAVVPVDESSASPAFIALWIASDECQRWLTGITKGVAYTGINIEDLRTLPLNLPQKEEQTEIVRRVETLFAFADRLEARLAQAHTAVERLTPALLAKAFRGELVPQDPADEPASVLLQRLAAQRAEAPKRGRRSSQASAA